MAEIIVVKYCIECKKAFDIGMNFEKCFHCRNKIIIKNKWVDNGKNQGR